MKSIVKLLPAASLRDVADEAFMGRHKLFARKGSTCVILVTAGFPDSAHASVARQEMVRKVLVELVH